MQSDELMHVCMRCRSKEPRSERLQCLMLQRRVYAFESATRALMQQGVWVKPPVREGSHA